jgi:predicted DNA-binding transcriptional regulator AlpA
MPMKETIVLGGKTYDSGGLLQDRYGLSPMTVYRWTKEGFLPQPIKLGRTNYYPRDEVEDRLSKGTDSHSAQA